MKILHLSDTHGPLPLVATLEAIAAQRYAGLESELAATNLVRVVATVLAGLQVPFRSPVLRSDRRKGIVLRWESPASALEVWIPRGGGYFLDDNAVFGQEHFRGVERTLLLGLLVAHHAPPAVPSPDR